MSCLEDGAIKNEFLHNKVAADKFKKTSGKGPSREEKFNKSFEAQPEEQHSKEGLIWVSYN